MYVCMYVCMYYIVHMYLYNFNLAKKVLKDACEFSVTTLLTF